jgi:hypothetical protein
VPSAGQNKSGVYYTLFADNNVYSLSDSHERVDTLYRFDFGRRNIPDAFFEGDLLSNFSTFREEYVMSVEYLTLSDEWMVFEPLIWNQNILGPYFHSVKTGETIDAKWIKEPYKTLVGHSGIREVTSDGAIYTLVGSLKLKTMIETLEAEDPDYQNSYPFLKGLIADSIDVEANDWLVRYINKRLLKSVIYV